VQDRRAAVTVEDKGASIALGGGLDGADVATVVCVAGAAGATGAAVAVTEVSGVSVGGFIVGCVVADDSEVAVADTGVGVRVGCAVLVGQGCRGQGVLEA
jgi:hypothetical protein